MHVLSLCETFTHSPSKCHLNTQNFVVKENGICKTLQTHIDVNSSGTANNRTTAKTS